MGCIHGIVTTVKGAFTGHFSGQVLRDGRSVSGTSLQVREQPSRWRFILRNGEDRLSYPPADEGVLPFLLAHCQTECVLKGGRVAVVTGANGGIGRVLVDEFLSRDFFVVAIGRDADQLAGIEAPHRLRFVRWDQGQSSEVPQELSSLNRVDVLVHNAGVAPIQTVADTTSTGLAHLMSVNLTSATTLTAALLTRLRAVAGHVVFVNSSGGLRGAPGWSGYLGSKSALEDLADSLRNEERESGVKVTTVFPGAVATNLLRQVREDRGSEYDPGNCVSASSAAKLITQVLDHPEDGYLTNVSFTRI